MFAGTCPCNNSNGSLKTEVIVIDSHVIVHVLVIVIVNIICFKVIVLVKFMVIIIVIIIGN